MTTNNTGLLTITIVIITAIFGILILPSAEISGEVFSVSPGNFMVMQSGYATARTSGETIICRFTGSTQSHWCRAISLGQGCTGIGSCTFRARGNYGTHTIVSSSCGANYDIRIDGTNEDLSFDCYKPQESIEYVQSELAANTGRTYQLKGKEYQVKVVYLAGQQAKFEINGEITEAMYPDTVMKLADGSIFIMAYASVVASGQPLAGFIIVR